MREESPAFATNTSIMWPKPNLHNETWQLGWESTAHPPISSLCVVRVRYLGWTQHKMTNDMLSTYTQTKKDRRGNHNDETTVQSTNHTLDIDMSFYDYAVFTNARGPYFFFFLGSRTDLARVPSLRCTLGLWRAPMATFEKQISHMSIRSPIHR